MNPDPAQNSHEVCMSAPNVTLTEGDGIANFDTGWSGNKQRQADDGDSILLAELRCLSASVSVVIN